MGSSLSGLLFDARWYASQHGLVLKKRDPEAAVIKHYLEVGAKSGHDPNGWFSEAFYRANYPDVRAGIARGAWRCGYQHYLLCGLTEFRSPSGRFNEIGYLGRNPDVLEKVRDGSIPNGFLHYAWLGQAEGRQFHADPPAPLLALPQLNPVPYISPTPTFAEALYMAVNRDVVDDGKPMPGVRHWLAYGLAEDMAGTRPRLSNWSENVYLTANPDLGPYIGPGGQPSAYSHFLLYGWAENRKWAGTGQERHGAAHLARALARRSPAPEKAEATTLPRISLIVPVYNPDIVALRACIASVEVQTYAGWQLCLADDGSTVPEVMEELIAASRRDERIRAIFAGSNGGISAASNLALAHADGAVVALLDHDDLLAPDALLHVARAYASRPDVDMVYTDEGKLTEAGELVGLNAKPGWSPELLLSTMYIGHLTTYRRSVVEQLGGFRSTFDGTQDYDLALRAAEIVRSVVHVPLPLYLWRMSAASTAGDIGSKPGVLQLQQRALESTLIRRGRPGLVHAGHGAGHWSVVLDPPPDTPLVSIVIPTAGRTAIIGGQTVDLVANCVRSLSASETYPNYEVVVVHNGDLRAETMLALADIPLVRLLHYDAASFNLSEKINGGVRAAAGEYVLLLNDDMQTESTAILQSMLGRMFDGVGVVGGMLLYANGSLQHAGVVWTAEGPTHAMIGEHRLTSGPAERLRVAHDCLAVSGACMFFRRDVFLRVGGYASHLPTNYNDVDFCLKLRAEGLRSVFNPDVRMFHFESLSKSGTFFWELQSLVLSHPNLRDPYLNPHFKQSSPFYEITDPDAVPATSYRGWMVSRIDGRRTKRPSQNAVRFSFLLSVYETPTYLLRELEATLMRQTYPNWELVLVDDASKSPGTIEWTMRMAERPNVTFIKLEKNRGIMGAYGAAFRAATGDYVVPIDHDDFLTLDCLDVLAWFLEANGMPDAVYSDEDKADTQSTIHSPFLKPDWDPILLTNMCYIAHVCAIRRSVAQAIGAYSDDAAAGCHDWDTFLRLIQAKARIMHVPEVLYSWRIIPGSTASVATGTKPYTISSQKHVLERHLRLTGLSRSFELVQNELFPHNGMWRLKPLEAALPQSAVIVVASAAAGWTARLLGDLALTPLPDGAKLMIVTPPGTSNGLDAVLPEVKAALWPKGPPQLAASLEEAIMSCVAEDRIAAVLDSSVGTLNRHWLREGLGMFAAASDVGAVSGQVLFQDWRIAWRGGFAGFGGMAGSPDYGRHYSDSGYHGIGWCQRSCDSIPASCFFVCPNLLADALNAARNGSGVGMRQLVGSITATAAERGLRFIYTPFVQVMLTAEVAVGPIMPDPVNAASEARPRYYAAAFGSTRQTAYALVPVPVVSSTTH